MPIERRSSYRLLYSPSLLVFVLGLDLLDGLASAEHLAGHRFDLVSHSVDSSDRGSPIGTRTPPAWSCVDSRSAPIETITPVASSKIDVTWLHKPARSLFQSGTVPSSIAAAGGAAEAKTKRQTSNIPRLPCPILLHSPLCRLVAREVVSTRAKFTRWSALAIGIGGHVLALLRRGLARVRGVPRRMNEPVERSTIGRHGRGW